MYIICIPNYKYKVEFTIYVVIHTYNKLYKLYLNKILKAVKLVRYVLTNLAVVN